jgi:hypothetical protein
VFLLLHSLCIQLKKENDTSKKEMATTSALRRKKLDLNYNLNSINNTIELLFEAINDHYSVVSSNKSETITYLKSNTWNKIQKLEKCANMKGLCESFETKANKWIEYFHLENKVDITDKDIDLLNETPLDDYSSLSIVDKLALWCCVRPEITNDILTKFNIHNFGGKIPMRSEFNITKALKVSSAHIPLLIMTPRDNEDSFINITNELIKKATLKSTKVNVISIDDDPNLMYNLISNLKSSIKNGSWLIIDNIELLTSWPSELLSILYQIKDSNKSKSEIQLLKDYNLNIPENKDDDEYDYYDNSINNNGGVSTALIESTRSKISGRGATLTTTNNKSGSSFLNPKFRLFLIGKVEAVHTIPTSLIYNSIKMLSQMSPNILQTHKTCQQYIIDNNYKFKDSFFSKEASALYCLLAHNSFKFKYNWNLQQFDDHLRLYSLNDIDLEKALNQTVYTNHLMNHTDARFVNKLIHQVIIDKNYDMTVFSENNHRIYCECQKIADSKSLINDIKRVTQLLYLKTVMLNNISGTLSNDQFEILYNNYPPIAITFKEINRYFKILKEVSINQQQNVEPNFKIFEADLNEYQLLFSLIVKSFESILNVVELSLNHRLFSNYDSKFLQFINNLYQASFSKINFFESLENVISNYNQLKMKCHNGTVTNKRIDMEILYNPLKTINKFIINNEIMTEDDDLFYIEV